MSIKLNKSEDILHKQLVAANAKNAADIFAKSGLPTRRIEQYHYTDLHALLDDIPQVGEQAKAISAPALRIAGAYRILVVNGEVQATTVAPAGVVVGTAKGGILSERNDAIISLNNALSKDALTLNLKNDVDAIIHIDRRSEGGASHINSSVKISLADNSSATIIETFSGSDAAHLSNNATSVIIGKNAKASHIIVDLSSKKTRHFQTVEYDTQAKALLHSLIVHSGSALARTQLFATFNGEKAHADLSGLMLTDDTQHSDITIDVLHGVPNTTSTETYKTVLRGQSKSIFQGKIIVAKDAQKTDAKMMSQALMLSDDAQFLTKPELEIFADDVICGHGATCGELDENHLFYLMSRGIAPEAAKSMLVRAFLEELFDPIKNEIIHEALETIADSWLA